MHNILGKKHMTVFRSWLVSYIIILIIPIITGIFVYTQSLATVKNEVSNVQLSAMTNLKSILDSRFEGFERICGQLSMNQDIKNMMVSYDNIDPNTVIYAYEAQKDLTSYTLSNPLLDNIYIYFNNADFMMSGRNKYNGRDINFMLRDEIGLSEEEFNRHKVDNNFMKCSIRELENGQKKLIILHSLFNLDYKSPEATIIFIIDGKKISSLLNSSNNTDGGAAFIIDSSNKYIGDLNSVLPQYAAFDELLVSDSIFNKEIDNNEKIVVHSKSSELQLEYAMIFSPEDFMRKLIYLRNIIYTYILFCLLVGGTISYYFAKSNYSPLSKLVEKIVSKNGDENTASKVNEYIIVESSFDELLKENVRYKQDIQAQRQRLRNNVLSRFVKGQIGTSILVKNMLEEQDINFEYNSFLIMLIAFDEIDQNNPEKRIGSNKAKAIASSIRDIVDSEINAEFTCYNIEIEGWLALLFNVEIKDDEEGGILLDSLAISSQRGLKDIRNKIGFSVFIAVSDIHFGYQGAHEAFSEATEIIEYKNFLNIPDRIIQYQSVNQINKESISEGHYNMEAERRFINSILAKDYNNALDIFNNIIIKEFDKLENLQLAKCRTFGIINSMINALGEISTTLDVDFFEQLDPTNRLLKTHSVQELKDEVKNIFYQISDYIDKKNAYHMPKWVEDVEKFVKNNYKNQNLSIESIAQNFNFNMSYLSRTYKKHRGIGLLDYLHSIRLEDAKKLILSGQKISEIASLVGYLDSKALIRAFKRYEGITPGQFIKISD